MHNAKRQVFSVVAVTIAPIVVAGLPVCNFPPVSSKSFAFFIITTNYCSGSQVIKPIKL